MTWSPNANDTRSDGSTKGSGWLGVQNRPDGRDSSELSVGTEINGKEREIPTMVPTLNKDEINYLLTTPPEDLNFRDHPVGKEVIRKAVEHAKRRDNEGKSPFADEQESKAAQAARKAHDDDAEQSAMEEAFKGGDK